MESRRTAWPLLLASLAGCQGYQAKPLEPDAILREVESQRHQMAKDPGAPGAELDGGFTKLAHALTAGGPILRRAREDFRRAMALARTSTPLPNPELTLGPLLGTDLDPGQGSRRLQPFVDFGFALPLSGRLAREDERNQAEAEAARIELIAAHRESYLELRRLWMERQMALRSEEVHRQALASIGTAVDLTRRLVDAGSAAALDLGLMELEAERHEADLRRARAGVLEIDRELSRLTGCALTLDGTPQALPPAAIEAPQPTQAKRLLVANHPDLGRLRAKYVVAERNLRLEIAKQYPDLRLGPSFAGDPGERKKVWGLTLGIALPLFDQNQQSIALAAGERDAVRAHYEAALNEALADLEGLLQALAVVLEEWRILEGKVLPRAKANAALSRRMLAAAGTDSLKHLEVERACRAAMLDTLNAELELRRILSGLERTIGLPLLPFQGEAPSAYPPLTFPEDETGESAGPATDGPI